ncbi:hypothetical protein TMatcc_005305 [Talaromyces marneffei ATCC 18224]
MANTILLRNGTVLSHDGDKVVVLKDHDNLIVGNTIDQIGQGLTLPDNGEIIDCTDKIISPGFIIRTTICGRLRYRPFPK